MIHHAHSFQSAAIMNGVTRHRLWRALLAALLLASLLSGWQPGNAAPESILLVNTAGDIFDVAGKDCSTVLIADLPGADGMLSLREAICASNNTAAGAPHTINFSIGSGVQTITPTSYLPVLTRPVTINGSSQPGYAGTPLIVLDGAHGAYGVYTGLWVMAGSTTIRGLVIQHFNLQGIYLDDPGNNIIQGNYIGVDPSGSLDRGNGEGIFIYYNSANNLIGGVSAGQGNLISGNGLGMYIDGSNTRVQGNKIGTNVAGTAALGNVGGIEVWGSDNTIGGSSAGEGNLISGNEGNGITLYGERNYVLGNKIGTNATGASALPNAGPGIRVNRGIELYRPFEGNFIGGAASGAGNLISGNLGNGVYIAAGRTTVQGNKIGTNLGGTAAVPNQRSGIYIDHGNKNTIGGLNSGEGNLISANLEAGLVIHSGGENQAYGNKIGTNASGTAAIGNGQNGVILKRGNRNTLEGNLISGNDGYGVAVREAFYNFVEDNKIGTNAAGSAALPNTYGGVALLDYSMANSIGWLQGNLISGNGGPGVLISGAMALDNAVTQNKIGVDVSGNLALGNAGDGITLWNASYNMIGGESAGQGNRIASNGGVGVQIFGDDASGNLLSDNQIGLGANGAALGNALDGVLISQANNNLIGGDGTYGRGNAIAYNRRTGVAITGDAWGNRVSENTLFDNRGLGIELGANGEVEANDILDADIGPNGYQNYPELSGLTNPTSSLSVAGTLYSTANGDFSLDFYASALCDQSGHGEGQQWLGSGEVSTNGSGVAHFNINLGLPLPAGKIYVTATATDADANTSEFSTCYPRMAVVFLPFVRR